MKKQADELKKIVKEYKFKLSSITGEAASEKVSPEKWSYKELVGHLIDSAANNHPRFVRMQHQDKPSFHPYDQDQWVSIQNYHEYTWTELVEVWANYNSLLVHVIRNINPEMLENTIPDGKNFAFIIPDSDPTLEYMVKDYNVHLLHHLKQIV